MSHLEAYDLIAHAEHIEQRLVATLADLANDAALVEERAWLEAGLRHVAKARSGVGDLLLRSLRLPELEPLRGDLARELQAAVIQALDGVHAAIAGAVERSPLLDLIYRNLKPVTMVKAGREPFEGFCQEIERRLASAYVSRMLADDKYASVAPAVETFRNAVTEWRDLFGPNVLPDEEAQALRSELESIASRVDVPLRQARLLAEAALITRQGLLAYSGLLDKVKRRAAKYGHVASEPLFPAAPASVPAAPPAETEG